MRKLIEDGGQEYAIINYYHHQKIAAGLPAYDELRALWNIKPSKRTEEQKARMDELHVMKYIPVELRIQRIDIRVPGGYHDGELSVSWNLIECIARGIEELKIVAAVTFVSEADGAD